MNEYPSAPHTSDPWTHPAPLQAEFPANVLTRPSRLVPFLTGLGQSFALVPVTLLVVIVFFQLSDWYPHAEEGIFVAVPALFIGALILAIKLARQPEEHWVGVGLLAGLAVYLVCASLFLFTLFVLLTEL